MLIATSACVRLQLYRRLIDAYYRYMVKYLDDWRVFLLCICHEYLLIHMSSVCVVIVVVVVAMSLI